MEKLSGCLVARLAEAGEEYPSELIDEINRQVHPPKPVQKNDIYIRAMYIVSDQINSQGGCFATEDLDHLARLLVDSPVMVGHRRDSLPLARNFKADKVAADDRTWVKSYFYWMKESEGAEDLKNNIDGGIYKECSISFLFSLPECSICGKDIRRCPHVPFQEYETVPGSSEIAHFKYRQVEKVLETSLVFRGAIADTKITDRLSSEEEAPASTMGAVSAALFSKSASPVTPTRKSFAQSQVQINRLSEFRPVDRQGMYVYPYQPGLVFQVRSQDDQIELETPILLGEAVRQHLVGMLSAAKLKTFAGDLLLFATKGNERLNGLGLMQVLQTEINLHRLHLRLCDLTSIDGVSLVNQPYETRLERLRSLGGQFPDGAVDLLLPKKLSADDWERAGEEKAFAEYRFGLELLCESVAGQLTRHILIKDRETAATVENISVISKNHLCCDFKIPGRGKPLRSVTCPNCPGLENQAVVLISEASTASKKPLVVLKDTIPGLPPSQLISAPMEAAMSELHIKRDGNRLVLLFPVENHWHKATIHHFSARLLGTGRKFVADVTAVESDQLEAPSEQHVPLKAVVKNGRLILLRPVRRVALFGEASGVWFRPALIDGEARYLFYADGPIDRQAGS